MKNKNLIKLVVIIVVALLGYKLLTLPDQRTDGQRIGDTIDTLKAGKPLDEAVKKLEKRTPGQKLGDAIKDNTEEK